MRKSRNTSGKIPQVPFYKPSKAQTYASVEIFEIGSANQLIIQEKEEELYKSLKIYLRKLWLPLGTILSVCVFVNERFEFC